MNTTRQQPISHLSLYLNEAGYEFLNVWRTPAFSLPTLAFPLLFYLFFGVVFQFKGGSGNQAAYLFGTYATFGIMGPALFGFGVGLATERAEGWLLLKQASPMPIGAYFFAKMAMSMMFALIIVVLLGLVANLAGGVHLEPLQWLQIAGLLVIGTLPFCALGLLIGCWARATAAVAIVNLVFLPMALLSGLWIPLSVFPQALKTLAPLFPSYHLSQLVLKVMDMDLGGSAGIHCLVLLVQVWVFLALAWLGFRRMNKT